MNIQQTSYFLLTSQFRLVLYIMYVTPTPQHL
jgi:hypothetical protein